MNMKRIKLAILLLLCLLMAGTAEAQAKNSSKALIQEVVDEFNGVDGVEVLELGSFSCSFIKMMAKLCGEDFNEDEFGEDDMAALTTLDGVKKITILDYEDAAADVRERIGQKLSRQLEGLELILEVVEDGEKMLIYGTINEKKQLIKDFILFTPSDCALICLFGDIPMEAVGKIAD